MRFQTQSRLTTPVVTLLALALFVVTFFTLTACNRRTPATHGASRDSSELRIASLSPAAADIVRDLGLADSLIGRNSADVWTDPRVRAVGELGRIDYESLIAANPTHVLVQEATMPSRLAELASRRGWTALNLSMLSLDEIRASTRRIVESLPESAKPRATEQLARFEQQMDRAWTADAATPDSSSNPTTSPADRSPIFKGRVLLLASIDPPAALGPGSFHMQILQRLGGTGVPATGSPYVTLNAEDIAAMAPDAIVLILPRDVDRGQGTNSKPTSVSTSKSPDEFIASLGVLGGLDIPAIRSRRVALIDDPKAHLPSTAMIGLADTLRKILAAWNK